jgi:NADH-quinone oxidoreductase subunit D
MIKTEEMVLNMGPQHPSTHGVLRLELQLDGELITRVTPHIGYLHRCFEKHAEAMTYPQIFLILTGWTTWLQCIMNSDM